MPQLILFIIWSIYTPSSWAKIIKYHAWSRYLLWAESHFLFKWALLMVNKYLHNNVSVDWTFMFIYFSFFFFFFAIPAGYLSHYTVQIICLRERDRGKILWAYLAFLPSSLCIISMAKPWLLCLFFFVFPETIACSGIHLKVICELHAFTLNNGRE